MNITMRQLQVFQAVAKNLSYTKAAAELHLTQPAVSMQIKQLEDALGLPLFEQLGKKIYLSSAGAEMQHYSRAIGQQLAEIREVFAALKGLQRGTLALSAPSTANAFVTHLLAAFCQQHPEITFNLDIANRQGLLNRLEHNETDLVIMGQPPTDKDLSHEKFMDNPLVVIASAAHPLARRKAIPLAELMENEFLVREQGSGTRIAMERFFAAHDVSLHTRMELASNEAIKQAVSAGLGLGIVSIHTLELEMALGRVKVLEVESFPIMRHWYIVHRSGKRLAPVAQAFKAFVLTQAKSLWTLADKR